LQEYLNFGLFEVLAVPTCFLVNSLSNVISMGDKDKKDSPVPVDKIYIYKVETLKHAVSLLLDNLSLFLLLSLFSYNS